MGGKIAEWDCSAFWKTGEGLWGGRCQFGHLQDLAMRDEGRVVTYGWLDMEAAEDAEGVSGPTGGGDGRRWGNS